MDTKRIAVLLEPFLDRPLSAIQLEQTSTYIDLLMRWNARINLTAIRDEEEIVTRHFGESFFLARHVFSDRTFGVDTLVRAARVIDLGSGAGFPAVPLKIWAPDIDLVLIEANHKKAAFLREVVRTLTLTNVNVITERAEAQAGRLGESFRPADLVTFRAIEKFDYMLPVATRFLGTAGRLALLVGESQLPALAAILPSHRWLTIPTPGSMTRVLAIGTTS